MSNAITQLAKIVRNIRELLERGGTTPYKGPVFTIDGGAPDNNGNKDLSYHARLDRANDFAVTPTVNGSPVWTRDSLRVGGQNLILNGNFNKSLGGWSLDTGYLYKTSDTDGNYIENNQTGQTKIGTGHNGYSTRWPATKGDIFIVSGDVYINGADFFSGAGGVYFLVLEGLDVNRARIENTDTNSLSPEILWDKPFAQAQWNHFTIPFKIAGGNTTQARLRLTSFANGAYRYRKFKVEKGTLATDWSPAPEDIQAQIDAINAKLDTLA